MQFIDCYMVSNLRKQFMSICFEFLILFFDNFINDREANKYLVELN